jgi:CubicO group peptidase (beta-lactamase class C family)
MRTLDAIAHIVTHQTNAAPCAVIAAAKRGADRAWRRGQGVSGLLAEGGVKATAETIFDLASITKSFTALTAARLAKQGILPLETELGAIVSEARGTPSEHVSIELLLAHRSGLAGHRAMWAPMLMGEAIDRGALLRASAAGQRDECRGPPPREGFAPVYSDLGYLLVGEAIARAAKLDLAQVIEREVCGPLRLRAKSARAVRSERALRIAPTERADFRGGVVIAAVHDENAWAASGLDVSGHAGLFGTAEDVLELGMALVETVNGERDEWLTAGELDTLVRTRPGGTLRAGFDGKSAAGSSSGALFGPRTFGHLGFTGTSLWIDPEASLVGVLLTNRVHPTRELEAIRVARPLVYDAIAHAFDGTVDP